MAKRKPKKTRLGQELILRLTEVAAMESARKYGIDFDALDDAIPDSGILAVPSKSARKRIRILREAK